MCLCDVFALTLEKEVRQQRKLASWRDSETGCVREGLVGVGWMVVADSQVATEG